MKKVEITSKLIQFTERPWWYTIQGAGMALIGGSLAILSIIANDVYILGENASWLPIICGVVMCVGIMRCIDALAANTAHGFLFNIQGGILDIVVGLIVIFSSGGEANNLDLLLVSYMITQGIYRNILLSVAEIRNPMPNRVTGLISILLGVMIWADWPTSPWFLAFSLSTDVCFRGWALIVMAGHKKNE